MTRFRLNVELEADEIESLIEALDCLKTKIAFTKGLTPGEKTERIIKADALETKLSNQLNAPPSDTK